MILKVFAPLAQMQINYPKKFDKLLKEKGYSSVRNFIRSDINKNNGAVTIKPKNEAVISNTLLRNIT